MCFDPRSELPFRESSRNIKAEVMSEKGEEHREMNKEVEGCEDMRSKSRGEGKETVRRCLSLSGMVGDAGRSLTGEETRSGRICWTGEPGGGPGVSAGSSADVTHGRPTRPASTTLGGALVQWRVGEEVARTFEACVEETGRLQRRREELVRELLAEEEVLAQSAGALRPLLERARGDLDHAHLRKSRVQEEVACVKRKLFTVARECIQNQVTLATQQYEVAQFNLCQEDLRAEVQQRLEELERLQQEHQHRLASLAERARGSARPRAASDLSHCRRAAADVARYTRASMASLDDWYEPRLLSLLRMRQATEDTMRKTRELGQNLKNRLYPLTLESQKLELERTCLQQKLNLMEQERRKSLTLHRETVSTLEDNIRDLQTEIQIQINTNQELAELNECLTTKTTIYRRCLGYIKD